MGDSVRDKLAADMVKLRPELAPVIEAEGWWRTLQPVTQEPAVADYLRGRGIDPERVEALDLARALPRGAECPAWARLGKSPDAPDWSRCGMRLILPLYAPGAGVASVRARRVEGRGRVKESAQVGGVVKGLAYASPVARALLAGALPDRQRDVAVVEGGPDFLSWATHAPGLAVLGIVAGSWTQDIARHLEGLTVAVRTHQGDQGGAGDKFAARVIETLPLSCDVYRGGAHPPGA